MHTLDLNVSVCREGKAELFLKVKFNFTPVLHLYVALAYEVC